MRFRMCMLLLSVAVTSVLGQDSSRSSTVTLGVGGSGGGYGGPAFTGRYEYRFFKYLAGEAGVDTTLPSVFSYQYVPIFSISSGTFPTTIYSSTQTGYTYFPFQNRDRVTMLPFGIKGILPLANGRVELFLGAGGAYVWSSRRFSAVSAWREQTSIGGRVALDRHRRFWVGTTWRFYGDLGNLSNRYVTDYNWYTGTADVGFRFGR